MRGRVRKNEPPPGFPGGGRTLNPVVPCASCVGVGHALVAAGREWPATLLIILRKEVIQPQVPLRLPCYDLVPIDRFVFGACPLAVGAATSDAPIFRGLTGGVYK